MIPLRYPFVAQGTRWKLWSGALMRPRPQVPSRRPLSRVLHLHQACMDHPLEVARQRLQVDGKPHPTAPSHPQAPKPVGALQLGVRSLDTSPYVIPLAPLLGGLGPPAPLDVRLHQVRLEDVGPRTPVQLHWATGSQGAPRMLSRQSGPLPAPAHPSARTPRWTGDRRGTPWPAPL